MAKQDLTPLVIKAQAGDEQALSDLMGACYETLYYYAYKTVNDPDLAGDITQESCIEIMETLGNLRDPGAFRTWSGKIVYHQCTKHFKQVKEVPLEENEDGETILDQLPDESRGSVPEQVQEDKEFQQTIMAMVDQLPEAQRSALMLYYYENLSVSQIAQIQDTTEGTVKSRLNYGRKAVKKEVEDYEKKHGVRLHSIAPLPLLLYFLFGNDAVQATQAAGKILAAVGKTVAAAAAGSAGTAAAATGTAATAATAATAGTAATVSTAGAVIAGVSAKVVAIAVAAVVGISAIVGTVLLSNEPEDQPEETTTQETTQETTQAPINHGTMEQWSAFFGTWYGSVDNAPIMEFAEGTLKIAAHNFTWTLEDCGYYAEEGYAGLDVDDGEGNYFAVTFQLQPDGCWNAEVVQLLPTEDPNAWFVNDDGESYHLYRPEDYEGYTLVTLTPQNALDYIISEPSSFKYYEDENISGLMHIQPQGFREGLGSASFCQIVPLIRDTRFTATPDEAVAGTKHFDGRFGMYADFEYPKIFYGTADYTGGSVLTINNLRDNNLRLSDEEYIGVVAVQGYVLVPEGYQIPERTPDTETALLDEMWGHWEPIPDFGNDSPDGITISRDGTVTINGFTANILSISLYDPSSRYQGILLQLGWEDSARAPVLYDKLELRIHPDGHLLAEYLTETPSEHGGHTMNNFCKPENYQEVEITPENYFDYVSFTAGITPQEDVDEDGNMSIYAMRLGSAFHFKDGVGGISNVRATVTGTCTVYETTLDDQGNVVSQTQVSQTTGELWIDLAAHMWGMADGPLEYHPLGEGQTITYTWQNWSDLTVTEVYGQLYMPVN